MPTPPVSPEALAWRARFGAHLRATREAHGLTQEVLAQRAGVDRKLIYRTELGQTSPRTDVLVGLAIAMDIEVAALIPS